MIYSSKSPYFETDTVNGQFLDIMQNRPIPGDQTDVSWTITPTYNLRPDLLAYDLYNDSRLWWVFAQRNPNTLKDPLFDFVSGVEIFLPPLPTLKATLNF